MAAAALVMAGTSAAESAETEAEYAACAKDGRVQAGTIMIGAEPTCTKGAQVVRWNAAGPTGPIGPAGPQGPEGPQGPAGTASDAFGVGTQQAEQVYRHPDCVVGEVILSAGSRHPGLVADGRLLPINENTVLFSVLGTTYGGDGRSTFALPDLTASAPNGLTYSICEDGIYPTPWS